MECYSKTRLNYTQISVQIEQDQVKWIQSRKSSACEKLCEWIYSQWCSNYVGYYMMFLPFTSFL